MVLLVLYKALQSITGGRMKREHYGFALKARKLFMSTVDNEDGGNTTAGVRAHVQRWVCSPISLCISAVIQRVMLG
jgi:hypothetical protein